MGNTFGLFVPEVGQIRVVACDPLRGPVWLAVSNEEEVHVLERTNSEPGDTLSGEPSLGLGCEYHTAVSRSALVEHLVTHGLRVDGPFTLRSGEVSDWYLDARQTTFDGRGARLVGEAVLEVLDPGIEAVGGMTMGADPIAVATAMIASERGRNLRAFSIRKSEKTHGTGGRLVGPVSAGTRVAILEDTTTTGSAAGEATDVALAAGLVVEQAIALVDRSDGLAGKKFAERGIRQVAVLTPSDLGFSS